MNNIPITAVVLTASEEESISRCLKSILWADEIIIVDNSVDATVDIVKKAVPKEKLKIMSGVTTTDFSRLRSDALKIAKNEWVFFVDADEVVSQELAQEIVQAVTDREANGFHLKRRDYFLGEWLRYGETKEVKLLKLGKKSAGNWERRVHETWKIEGTTKTLDHYLEHYPHPTITSFLAHINRWTTLDAQEFYDDGVRSNWFKIILYPKGKFIKNYIFKLGFLDGMPGLLMSIMMSFHSFLTRAKLYQLQNKRK